MCNKLSLDKIDSIITKGVSRVILTGRKNLESLYNTLYISFIIHAYYFGITVRSRKSNFSRMYNLSKLCLDKAAVSEELIVNSMSWMKTFSIMRFIELVNSSQKTAT